MGILGHPRPAKRKRERQAVEARLARHAQFMNRLEEEGWDRKAASAEAYRMLREVEKLEAGQQ